MARSQSWTPELNRTVLVNPMVVRVVPATSSVSQCAPATATAVPPLVSPRREVTRTVNWPELPPDKPSSLGEKADLSSLPAAVRSASSEGEPPRRGHGDLGDYPVRPPACSSSRSREHPSPLGDDRGTEGIAHSIAILVDLTQESPLNYREINS